MRLIQIKAKKRSIDNLLSRRLNNKAPVAIAALLVRVVPYGSKFAEMEYHGNFWHLLPFRCKWGPPVPDEILRVPELAQLLKVAEKTVYTMAQKSQLPAFKVRGQWRFKRVDIDRWIEQQKETFRDEGRN